MRAHLFHVTVLQYQNLVAVADRAETMGHKHTGAALLFENAVDILEESLLCVGVQGRCLERSVDCYEWRVRIWGLTASSKNKS